MADVPPEMMAHGREPDQHFENDEELYHRFSPEKLDGDEITIAAVKLPDMSVMREKYGRPRWLLLDEEYANWGVLAFRVKDIPPSQDLWQEGVIAYRLEPRHAPYHRNYAHAEVWVFRDGAHLCLENNNVDLLDHDFHLRWREHIVFASRIAMYPARSG